MAFICHLESPKLILWRIVNYLLYLFFHSHFHSFISLINSLERLLFLCSHFPWLTGFPEPSFFAHYMLFVISSLQFFSNFHPIPFPTPPLHQPYNYILENLGKNLLTQGIVVIIHLLSKYNLWYNQSTTLSSYLTIGLKIFHWENISLPG